MSKFETGKIFIADYTFVPEPTITNEQMMDSVVELLQRLFQKEGKPLDPPKGATPKDRLARILTDIKIALSEEEFQKLPATIKRQFVVRERDGTIYRYGNKPRGYAPVRLNTPNRKP